LPMPVTLVTDGRERHGISDVNNRNITATG
jgi:hypothetical protein